MPTLARHEATRYVQPLREGGSLPAVVDTDGGGLFVVKFRGAGQGAKALIAELVVGQLAQILDLPVPELAVIDLSEAFGRIADRAVQMHGAAGIAMDLPIARIFQDARAARIYDGPSEVHRMTIARDMLKLAAQGESVRAAAGDL